MTNHLWIKHKEKTAETGNLSSAHLLTSACTLSKRSWFVYLSLSSCEHKTSHIYNSLFAVPEDSGEKKHTCVSTNNITVNVQWHVIFYGDLFIQCELAEMELSDGASRNSCEHCLNNVSRSIINVFKKGSGWVCGFLNKAFLPWHKAHSGESSLYSCSDESKRSMVSCVAHMQCLSRGTHVQKVPIIQYR